MSDAVLRHLEDRFDDHVAELQDFVRIPSVSAQPDRAPDVRAAATWLADRLRAAGFEHVGLVETSGHPAVVADWLHAGAGAPTVLMYGHYDVQPAHKDDGWAREPFGAVVDDERIWGRGTTDDKGQMMCHVLGAEAWLKAEERIPVNVKFVFEGEEEIGSLHFKEVIDRAGDRLEADVLLVSDSPMRGEDEPALTYSLRGLCYLQVDVEGPATDLHSGTFGGALRNPIEALVHMLASCKDPVRGKVLVPGFYDDVLDPSDEERRTLAEVGEPGSAVAAAAGTEALFGEEGWSTQERINLRPTFEINGIWGGYTGEGAKTVIPATAHAKLSCRLVADQDPARIATALEAHLRAVAPAGIRVDVTDLGPGHPVRTDPKDPAMQAVQRALEATFQRPCVAIPMGGSIPAVADMQRRLGARPVLCGFGHRDENMHAPEESFRLKNFRRGREACARMLGELAGLRT